LNALTDGSLQKINHKVWSLCRGLSGSDKVLHLVILTLIRFLKTQE